MQIKDTPLHEWSFLVKYNNFLYLFGERRSLWRIVNWIYMRENELCWPNKRKTTQREKYSSVKRPGGKKDILSILYLTANFKGGTVKIVRLRV